MAKCTFMSKAGVRMKQRVRYVAVTVTLISVISVTLLLRELPASDLTRTTTDGSRAITRIPAQDTRPEHVNKDDGGELIIESNDSRANHDKKFGVRGVTNKTHELESAIDRLLLDIRGSRSVDVDLLLEKSYPELVTSLGQDYRNAAKHLHVASGRKIDKFTPNYRRFHYGIQKYSLYNPANPSIDGLLHDMASLKIVHVDMMTKGTMLKLLVTLSDGGRAVLKPMRWGRDYETLPNQFYFNDFERHNSEIASFHLDRLLGFYAVPPVTGRMLNMTRDVYMLAEKKLQKTFFVSPIGNLCFFGECSYYCDSGHAFCGTVDQMEASLMAYLPMEAKPLKWKSPYRRSYSRMRSAEWESDPNYCNRKVKPLATFRQSSQLLLSFIDTHIFDFLTGNMDRHHVNLFSEFGNDSMPIHIDNGRGFGKTKRDELSILAPLRQCCVVRQSTVHKFLNFARGPERLSALFDMSLRTDPLYPIVNAGHYEALDRRVKIVLADIANCVKRAGSIDSVIIKNPI